MIDSIGLFLLQMMAKLIGDDKKLLQFFRRKAAVQIVFALDDPLFDALMDGQSLGSEHQFFQSPIPVSYTQLDVYKRQVNNVAAAFHRFYTVSRIRDAETEALRDARVYLIRQVATVIENGLSVFGVTAPDKM